ncbi:MarR family winged helix-turn-helix transcriptional regulator [Neobacillus sp. SM06]|uniref:MarR family winged helix-turn-helix transcriptional regulator n=1 Tax=Neobacillus sp. SM06 TaxID=3422492 RepID=UPI003D2A16E7
MEKQCSNLPYLALMQTSKAVQDRIRLEMTKNNLSLTEFSVLEILYFKAKQTIHQVGNRVLISSGSMTYVIDKLEKRGLLNRIACPDDRRVIYVALTEEGIRLMGTIMPEHQEMIDYLFGCLNKGEAEQLAKWLKQVSERASQ